MTRVQLNHAVRDEWRGLQDRRMYENMALNSRVVYDEQMIMWNHQQSKRFSYFNMQKVGGQLGIFNLLLC
jgi:hypothetical protein